VPDSPHDSAITPEIIERLARAVAEPGSPLLYLRQHGDTKKGDGWEDDFGRASRCGKSFAVLPRRDALILDADSPEETSLLLEIRSQLEAEGIDPVLCASGRHGHSHLIATRIPLATRAKWIAWADRHGIDRRKGSGGRIRPPLSPHPAGLPVRLLYPSNVEEAIKRLDRSNAKPRNRRMAPRTQTLLRDGKQAPEAARYRHSTGRVDRSKMMFAIVRGLLNVGWSGDEVRAAILDERNSGGEKLRDFRNDRARLRYLNKLIDKARRTHRPAFRDRANVQLEIDRIESLVRSPLPEFSSRGGRTLRLVLLEHLAIARRIGNLTVGASEREIAERIGMDRKTVHTSRRELRSGKKVGGWLLLASGSEREKRRSSRWRILVPRRHLCNYTPHAACTPPTTGEIGESGYVAHDLWRARGGLGKAAAAVYDLIGGRTVKEIAAALCGEEAAIRKQLRKLRDKGLADRDSNGRWHRTSKTIDHAARELGISGAGEAQKDRHREERLAFDSDRRRRGLDIVDKMTGEVVNADRTGAALESSLFL